MADFLLKTSVCSFFSILRYDSVNANYVDLFELTLGLGRLTHALMNHLSHHSKFV